MILRFLAFSRAIDQYKGRLKQFLTDSMKTFADECEREPGQVDVLRATFLNTIQNVVTVFGPHSGRVYRMDEGLPDGGQWESKFSIAAFDIQSSALIAQPAAMVQAAQEQISEAYISYVLTDSAIKAAISGQGTTKREPTRLRWFGFRSQVQKLLSEAGTEPRYFPYKFRKKLFEASNACGLCPNPIHYFDDCVVDHIQAFSRGGKTVESNGQLAHRRCNALKGAGLGDFAQTRTEDSLGRASKQSNGSTKQFQEDEKERSGAKFVSTALHSPDVVWHEPQVVVNANGHASSPIVNQRARRRRRTKIRSDDVMPEILDLLKHERQVPKADIEERMRPVAAQKGLAYRTQGVGFALSLLKRLGWACNQERNWSITEEGMRSSVTAEQARTIGRSFWPPRQVAADDLTPSIAAQDPSVALTPRANGFAE